MTAKKPPLASQKDEHLMCRDLRHSWVFGTDFTNVRGSGNRIVSVTRLLICTRCGAQRRDEYALPSFDRIRTSYSHPAGYLLTGWKGRVPISDIRRVMYDRAMKATKGDK